MLPTTLVSLSLVLVLLFSAPLSSIALTLLLAGGTGPIGQGVAARCTAHDVTVATRNAFLAATPSRVSADFGWVGQHFLKRMTHVRLRDWDGGDLLDIVGNDWLGWQDDCLKPADIVVHLVGGYTEQRVMACERLVRESLRVNPSALHVTVSPVNVATISPGLLKLKNERLDKCERMVQQNCLHFKCLRLNATGNQVEEACNAIQKVIDDWETK
jgi:hypothetical protein